MHSTGLVDKFSTWRQDQYTTKYLVEVSTEHHEEKNVKEKNSEGDFMIKKQKKACYLWGNMQQEGIFPKLNRTPIRSIIYKLSQYLFFKNTIYWGVERYEDA